MARGQRRAPSPEERKGKRAHDEHGNVRPADGRWDLHRPQDESKYVRTEIDPTPNADIRPAPARTNVDEVQK